MGKFLDTMHRMRAAGREHVTQVKDFDGTIEASCSCGWEHIVITCDNWSAETRQFALRRVGMEATKHWSAMINQAKEEKEEGDSC